MTNQALFEMKRNFDKMNLSYAETFYTYNMFMIYEYFFHVFLLISIFDCLNYIITGKKRNKIKTV